MNKSDNEPQSDIKGVVVFTFVTILGLASLAALIAGLLSLVAGMDLVPEENRTKAVLAGLAGSVFWLGSLFAYIKQRRS